MELANPQHEAFCQHVAAGLSLTESAKRSGYAEGAAHNQGSRMGQRPNIAARIDELKSSRSTVITSHGIRSPQSRVTALEDRWLRMSRIIMERSEDPEMDAVPGGKTGLLIKQVKQIGTGDKAQVVTSFILDRDLLTELRQHEQQAAEELGQWTTRKETYNQTLKLAVTKPAELREVLRSHYDALPVEARLELESATDVSVMDSTNSEQQALECAPAERGE